MTPPQHVAVPAGEPQAALIAVCVNCRGEIMRLALDSAKWRHDNGAVTCPPTDTTPEHHTEGDQA